MNSNTPSPHQIWVDLSSRTEQNLAQTLNRGNFESTVTIQEARQETAVGDRPIHLPAADFWVALTVGAVAMVTTVVVVEFSTVKAVLRHALWTNRTSRKIPCAKCLYFSDNFYLKCTVNPTDVLTERAVECRDYCSQNSEKTKKEPEKRL